MPAPLSFALQVALLEKKRAVLSGLTQLIISLEQLRAGLEAVLLLGGNASALSTKELRSIEVIRQRVITLSDPALRFAVQQLDTLVSSELEQLISLSLQLAEDARTDMSELGSLNQQANTFNRNARTLIAMRALLGKRGEVLPPLQFPLPQAEIAERMQQVDAHEQHVRQQAIAHIEGMRADISLMLTNPACSETQQVTFGALNQALTDNLQHIQAGLSLTELPMPIDDIEVGGSAPSKSDKDPSNAEDAVANNPATEPDGTDTTAKGDAATKANSAQIPQRGLFQRLGGWLNSPWNEGWKSTKKPPQ